jgi:hypothetical protein
MPTAMPSMITVAAPMVACFATLWVGAYSSEV